jgi:hypothetical protein
VTSIRVIRMTGERVTVDVPDGTYWFCDLYADLGADSYSRHLLVRADDRKAAHALARKQQQGVELLDRRATTRMPYPEVAVLLLNGWDVIA